MSLLKCIWCCTTAVSPVTLRCDFTTTDKNQLLITWKYKSYCRDPIQAALNPSNADNAIAQSNPNYNPNIECSDSARTVRIVASTQMAISIGSIILYWFLFI
uniref:Uncharacterized protein n=1 Tax=Cyprinus carpio TaxID=7962 RepID=A0A8C2E9S7_CYPCA